MGGLGAGEDENTRDQVGVGGVLKEPTRKEWGTFWSQVETWCKGNF